MTGLAIALVLGAALIHASWNYLLKKSGGGIGFVWAFAALSSLLYAPLAAGVVIVQHFEFTIEALAFLFASAVLHTAYYLLLDRGYRHGDLSLVYPLARATGPFLTILVAVAMLGERPGTVALCGAALVVGGAFFLAASPAKLRDAGASRGITFALLTGCMIASYTVVDKQAVSAVLIPPLLQDWGANLGRVIVMAPLALRRHAEVKAAWTRQRKAVILVALLCPLSYILVLTAMVFTPVSYVAPAREISILFGALMGAHLLPDGDVPHRRRVAAVKLRLERAVGRRDPGHIGVVGEGQPADRRHELERDRAHEVRGQGGEGGVVLLDAPQRMHRTLLLEDRVVAEHGPRDGILIFDKI